MTRIGVSVRARLLVPALLLHGASWFALLVHGTAWRGAWMSAVDQVAGTVVITGPLLSALVAHEYARRQQTSLPALLVSSAHPLRGWYQPVLRLWAVAAANLVALIGEVALLVVVAGPPLFARPLIVLPLCCLVLATHAGVGMAIGLRLGPRLAGAVAGTVSFGLFLLAVAHLAPASFAIAGASGDLVGETYRSGTLATLVGIAVVSLVAIAATTTWATRGRMTAAVALTCVVGAMLLSSPSAVDLDDKYEAVPISFVCRGEVVAVCVPAEAPRSLPAAATRMNQLVRPLLAAKVELPGRWSYYTGLQPFHAGGLLYMRSGGVRGTRVWDDDLTWSLTEPAFCAGYFDDTESERSFQVRLLLQQWISFRNGVHHPHAPWERAGAAASTRRAWFGSPESAGWVRSTYAKLRRCDLADLRYPAR